MNGRDQSGDVSTRRPGHLRWLLAGLVVAAAGTAGSLWLSLGMGLKACPLCLYQRTFILAVAGILLVGLFSEARRTGLLNVLALPGTVGGLGVAAFHEYLELAGKLECPAGILGLGTAPQQSLAVFVLLLAVLAAPLVRKRSMSRAVQTATGLVLGVLFAIATIKSAPPMPAPPDKPYDSPLEVCRPPYVAPDGEVNAR